MLWTRRVLRCCNGTEPCAHDIAGQDRVCNLQHRPRTNASSTLASLPHSMLISFRSRLSSQCAVPCTRTGVSWLKEWHAKIRADLLPTIIESTTFWAPVHLVNFYVVRPPLPFSPRARLSVCPAAALSPSLAFSHVAATLFVTLFLLSLLPGSAVRPYTLRQRRTLLLVQLSAICLCACYAMPREVRCTETLSLHYSCDRHFGLGLDSVAGFRFQSRPGCQPTAHDARILLNAAASLRSSLVVFQD